MTTQNLQDSVKAVLRGRFITIQAYLKKQEKQTKKTPNFIPKTTRKRRNEEPQSQQKKRNHKSQSRDN